MFMPMKFGTGDGLVSFLRLIIKLRSVHMQTIAGENMLAQW